MREKQVNPEALLHQLQKEKQGRLTVFLGAAAGVGKTYAMLEAAHTRLSEGIDLVAGWVETHGRAETNAMVSGLPTIAPKELQYHGKTFNEMDLDAILKRHPQVVLVDELAHTNIPGARHVRRFQDVEELLAAGISVYTTMNIQHVESLNDIVAQITGIRVRETVPDRLLEAADQIQLIDIPPEELIKRLKEGKVYVPHQAEQALQKFFRPGNINALRELALRQTAQRVDQQLVRYMKRHDIEGPWPANERVLACISSSPFSAQVIRAARRMARGIKADFLAAYVETSSQASDEQRRQLDRNIRLAESLGAEIVSLHGQDVAQELLLLARQRSITHIMVGRPIRSGRLDIWRSSLVDKIIRQSDGISVHIIPGKVADGKTREAELPGEGAAMPYTAYLMTFFMVAALTILIRLMPPVARDHTNVALSYLLPVLFSATHWGRGPSIMASLLGFLAFDFFFVPPFLSFTVADLRLFISLVVFLAVAIITSTLAHRLGSQVKQSRRRERVTAALYAMSRELAAETDLRQALHHIVRRLNESVEADVSILTPDENGKLAVTATSKPASKIADSDMAVATWVFEHGKPAGKGTGTLEGVDASFSPIRGEKEILGVIGLCPHSAGGLITQEQSHLLEAAVSLASLTITRLELASQAEQVRYLRESEKLRTALFNSVSHDLRTPLAGITGAVTSLIDDHDIYSDNDRISLLQTIKEGSNRMTRLINNILDMARLESGMLKLNTEWCDVEDIIGSSLQHSGDILKDREVRTNVPGSLPLVQADFVLIEEVITNLLDNAAKYSPPGSLIGVSVRSAEKKIHISIADRGDGVPDADKEKIFDKFYRMQSPRRVAGTGLGLSICKGIVEAHGGDIWVEDRSGGGSIFVFTLRVAEQPIPPADRPGDDDVGDQGPAHSHS